MTKPVIVGVDGSASAEHAVRWAAIEAAHHRVPLHLVHACLEVAVHTPVRLPRSFDDALREQGEQHLATAAGLAEQAAPDVPLETQLVVGTAAEALTELSRQARLAVLGSRGLGGFTSLVVGSVAVALAAHGHCPVVVVRGARTGEPPPWEGPVVVGVDGTAASDGVLEFAFDAASRRNAALIAVHAWNDLLAEGTWAMAPHLMLDWAAIEDEARLLLAERLAGWQEKFPDVPVRRVVGKGTAPRALLRHAAGARLLVVGSRGRGGLRGMLLGSTSQALLHHAPCPVAVVRPARTP
ncbi:universal stress protein [Allokutzneria oryzae]|uniref:Universal stress protein n=1 Tax=Allokutzneria oryzae TaxID=1378989 RepID=A0ABV6A377_9PSEU